jgi:hypothetical protein
MWMLEVSYSKYMYNHHVDYLYFSISVGMESSGLGQFGVYHGPNARSKYTYEIVIPIKNNDLSQTKMNP